MTVTLMMRELVHKSNPAHVRVQVFVGRQKGSRGNAGEITIRRDEWEEWQRHIAEDALGVAAYVEIGSPLDLDNIHML